MGSAAPGHLAEPFWARRRGLVVVLAAAALALVGPAAQAAALSSVETVITGEHLQLVSVTSPAMSALRPGQSATWDVGLEVTTAGPASVDVSLHVLDAPEDTFEVEVARCDERWTAQGCATTLAPLLAAPLVAGEAAALETTDGADTPWYRVTVTMVGEGSGASATLRLVADGAGEELTAGPGPGAPGSGDAGLPGGAPLPDTGAAVLGHLALAVGAVVTGWALAWWARRRRVWVRFR